MKNNLWYLGFLSLFSLLYFVEGKTGFLGFIGFLPYFGIYSLSDERIEKNVGRATRNAFIYTILMGVGTINYIYLTNSSTELFAPAFIILFGGSMIVSLISLYYYDRKGV